MVAVQVFKALGDPIRLEMVQRLSNGSPCTITSVSNNLGITRQGARKHLEVLERAQLVTFETKGREVYVQLERDSLDAAKLFISELERRWDQRLENLRQFVDK